MDKNHGHIGLGTVVKNHEGIVLAIRSTTRNVIAEPIVAEALAALHAMELCQEMGFNYIILDGDALQIVLAFKAEGNNWSKFGYLVDGIKEGLRLLRSGSVIHVKKSVNVAAHTIARGGFCVHK